VAGFGLGGYPFAFGKYMNGALYVLSSAPAPALIAGVGTRRVDVAFTGAHVVARADDMPVIAIYNADYADATSHGVVWRGAEDSISTIDNFSLNGRPRCVAGLSLSTTSINSGGGSITVAVTAPDAAQSTRIDSRSTSL
jgi:hypothetical protein